jgi:hypothetical protein
MKHVLGVLGVIAAGILLAVSAAMNYRFGFSLGKTATDGQIYGLASAAADCFKALAPFFFFAALRNKMWSQAMAAAVVWLVVTAYSMTSALGHAALNRLDTTGQRAVEAANYKDLRADSKRAQEQLAWVPQHRPVATVESDLNGMRGQRAWTSSRQCTDVTTKVSREFCQQYFKVNAELGSAKEAEKLEARIAQINAKLAKATGGTVLAESDPQASVLARLSGLGLEQVQTALTIFVALLIEIGSGFGMYVAFAHWRLHEPAREREAEVRTARARTAREDDVHDDLYADNDDLARRETEAEPAAAKPYAAPAAASVAEPASATPAPQAPAARSYGANDNRVANGVPDSDVQRFYRERVLSKQEGSSVTAQDLYEDYCVWCEEQDKEPFAHPRVSREIKELGVRKERIGGRVRYIGIALRSAQDRRGDHKLPAALSRAA